MPGWLLILLLLAAYLVKSLPLVWVRWLVVVVVLYAAATMLRSAAQDASASRPSRKPVAVPESLG